MKSKFYFFLVLLSSCSLQDRDKEINLNSCKINSESIDNRSLVRNINVNSKKISRCLNNFLLFTQEKSFSYSGCVRLLVSKGGEPRDVKIYPSNIPIDLQMCIEQEIWSFDFQNLSFSKAQRVQFPLKLKR